MAPETYSSLLSDRVGARGQEAGWIGPIAPRIEIGEDHAANATRAA